MSRVGIAMAAFRPEPVTFEAQLASIAAQDHPDWFAAITLDSPLAALRAVPSLERYFGDARFSFEENEKRLGVVGNFGRAIARVTERGARWVACADQDDLWCPRKISTLVRAMEGKPALALVHADMDVLRGADKSADSAWTMERRRVDRVDPASLLVRNVVTGASMLFDAELARRYGTIPDGALVHDHWYAFVASLCGGVHPVHERLHAYRQHDENVIGVRPYRGLFDGMGPRELLAKRDEAARNFRARKAYVDGALALGLAVPEATQALVGPSAASKLLSLAMASGDDATLRREALAVAAGCALNRE